MGKDKAQQEDDWLKPSVEKECDEVVKIIKAYPPVEPYRNELNDLIQGSITQLRLEYTTRMDTFRKLREKEHAKRRKKLYTLKKQKGIDLTEQIADLEKDAPERHQ